MGQNSDSENSGLVTVINTDLKNVGTHGRSTRKGITAHLDIREPTWDLLFLDISKLATLSSSSFRFFTSISWFI